MLVKICGLKTTVHAAHAINEGADLLGVIMVPGRRRTVDHNVAKEISKLCAEKRAEKGCLSSVDIAKQVSATSFKDFDAYFAHYSELIAENGPFLVGVFQNQLPSQVFELAGELGLDFVQLHGSEDVNEFIAANSVGVPIIKRYVIPRDVESMHLFFQSLVHKQSKTFALPLLDSELGGEGTVIDWSLINKLQGRFILAGGLTAENLGETAPYAHKLVGYDVSGGVETDGAKSASKISRFIASGKLH